MVIFMICADRQKRLAEDRSEKLAGFEAFNSRPERQTVVEAREAGALKHLSDV